MLDFLPFQSFPSAEAAQPLLTLLRQHEIPFETATDTGELVFNPAFTFHNTYATFVVKLHGADFEYVRRLQEDAHRDALAALSPDHYLFSFTDAELFDLLAKPEEWSPLDVTLAGQLLRQRGRDVSADAIRLLREHRVVEQNKPELNNKGRIRLGYLFALLGGFGAIFMGWELYSHKKTLNDGRQIAGYSAHDRVHGLRIMTLGTASFILWIAVRLWLRAQ
ncbi:hypothetical protein [Hymenobacter properus]|uniref:Uncharacterized protein n=1 Tax=Hymenobacter properus TaxID=2791026 RepID=A0A931BED6_9BACT|nr:hypothetical protein [Hymenobacter properus]MBF9140141.1 hypothetical protein [Hymenobacter properus]MBR7718948.1 hypothetical protein [Microvirga sp. SRT04]